MLEGKTLTPINDCILTLMDGIRKQAGSIFIPESSQEQPTRSTVVAVGGEVKNVQPGQRVVFKSESGTRFIVGGANYLMLREFQILAIEEQEARAA